MSDKFQVALDPENEFDSVLIDIKETHDRKKADYSSKDNRFSNFEFAAMDADISTQKVFEVLIGIKNARLRELLQPGRDVLNEPIEDTFLDRAVYCVLAYAYWRKKTNA